MPGPARFELLLIADHDAEARASVGWALRDLAKLIEEVADETALTRRLARCGPLRQLAHDPPERGWRMLAVTTDESVVALRILVVYREDKIGERLRSILR